MQKSKHIYITFDELYDAYIDCLKRKRSTRNAQLFVFEESRFLYELYCDINNLKYNIGKSIAFCVDKPVKREVFAADFRDRIVHHLVVSKIINALENEFIDDSYSCRKGKGTDYGINRCEMYMKKLSENYTKDCYIIKCDLKSFFMTISKELLLSKLTKFCDEKCHFSEDESFIVKYLLEKIVMNQPQLNCVRKQNIDHWDGLPKEKSLFSCKEGYGLPIGNLTSQIFANFYLSEFDHFIKEVLKIEGYGRYVDDFFLIVETKEKAIEALKRINDKLNSLGVTLHPKKLYIQKIQKGVKFIGAVLKKDRKYIANRSKGNFFQKVKALTDELLKQEKVHETPSEEFLTHAVSSFNSYLGFLKHYMTFKIKKKIFISEMFKPWLKYIYYNDNLTKVSIFEDYRTIPHKKKNYTKLYYYRNKIGEITKDSLNLNINEFDQKVEELGFQEKDLDIKNYINYINKF